MIRYNLISTLRPQVLWGVLRRKHGPGWFKLKAQWYLHPSEWFHVVQLASILSWNLLLSFFPLFPLEWAVNVSNPKLQRRIPRKKRALYAPSSWSFASQKKAMA